ncbi:MAG: Coenzyme F420 hydrogenase/dehydrogenase, beta subunit C-terminal domain [Polyangiales bacterium]
MRAWTNEEVMRYLGSHRSCYLTHASDSEGRNGAASGGSTSQIAMSLLDQGIVDGVLVWRMVYGGEEPDTEAVIATSRSEILATRGSKYCAVSYPKEAIPKIEAFEGKLAVVTVPCDASYLRRKMAKSPALREKIHCIITLFCGHNSEPALTKLFVERHGTPWRDVEDFRYRTGDWRGTLTCTDKDGSSFETPTSAFTHYQNLHFFSQRKCLSCVDHYGYDGDICTGDIWSLDMKGRSIKPTLVVTRNERGQELFDQARGALDVEEVEPKIVVNGNSRGLTYHYNISARSRVGKLFGIQIKDTLRLPTTALDRLIAFFGLFNYWLSHHPRLSGAVKRMPTLLVRAYIYFFKGLQQLNLFFYRPFPPGDQISLIGATLAGNRGAEAMLVTTVGRIRDTMPDSRFVIHSYFPKEDRAICNDLGVEVVDAGPKALVVKYFPFSAIDRVLGFVGLNWPRAWMPRGPRELAKSNALIDLSGIAFSDGREKFIPFNVLNNWPAMLFRIPVVKLSQGLGLFEGWLNRTSARWILKRCARVFARGAGSFEATEALDLGDRLGLAPDIAFSFRSTDSLTEENPDYEDKALDEIRMLAERTDRVVALSVSSVVHKKCEKRGIDYVRVMTEVTEALVDRGLGVVVYPNATREHTNSLHNNDLPIVRDIHEGVSEERRSRVVPIGKDLNTKSLRVVLEPVDCMIASRFHAMISGLSLAKPIMVLGWGHKYKEVLAQFGIEEWCFDFSDLRTDFLMAQVDRFLASTDEIRTRIEANLPTVQRDSASQFAWLAEFLEPELDAYDDDDDA